MMAWMRVTIVVNGAECSYNVTLPDHLADYPEYKLAMVQNCVHKILRDATRGIEPRVETFDGDLPPPPCWVGIPNMAEGDSVQIESR